MLRVEKELNKMSYLMSAVRYFDVSGFQVLLSGGLLSPKRNVTHWKQISTNKNLKFWKETDKRAHTCKCQLSKA